MSEVRDVGGRSERVWWLQRSERVLGSQQERYSTAVREVFGHSERFWGSQLQEGFSAAVREVLAVVREVGG